MFSSGWAQVFNHLKEEPVDHFVEGQKLGSSQSMYIFDGDVVCVHQDMKADGLWTESLQHQKYGITVLTKCHTRYPEKGRLAFKGTLLLLELQKQIVEKDCNQDSRPQILLQGLLLV